MTFVKTVTTFAPPLAPMITHSRYSLKMNKTQSHCCLGHPGTSMYHRILKDTHGIPPTVNPTSMKEACVACAQGKLQIRPSVSKTTNKIPAFLEQLNVDVCGPIDPPSGPFQFFL